MTGERPLGRVILVGAGPGDPGLITVRGAEALRQADVVVHDALSSPELLKLARPAAECVNVGKRGHDPPTRTQDDINALLVHQARAGKLVVRLKGGDPFVFGRGGEEASACVEAGVDFEVIPGVSAALAVPAYAGIPVTDRRHAASFAVITGHSDPADAQRDQRLDALARGADTLIVLMGMRKLDQIVTRLLELGRPSDQPAAAIMNGTTRRQRVVKARLAELPKAVEEAGLGAPATLVIGQVVGLRDTLAWFEGLPLFGLRVLVTRARDQAGRFVSVLRRAGAEPVLIPMIRIEGVGASAALRRTLKDGGRHDFLLFTSGNAVRHFSAAARALGGEYRGAEREAFCVGPMTAEAARHEGFRVRELPRDRFDGEGLRDALLANLDVNGVSFLHPRAAEGREELLLGLRSAGASVESVTVYRTVPAEVDAGALRDDLVRGALDVLTFTSPSTVERFVGLLDAAAREGARGCIRVAIGRVTAGALRNAGLEPTVTAERPGADGVVEALTAHLASLPPGDLP